MLDSQLDACSGMGESPADTGTRFEIDAPVTRSGEMVIDGRLVRRYTIAPGGAIIPLNATSSNPHHLDW